MALGRLSNFLRLIAPDLTGYILGHENCPLKFLIQRRFGGLIWIPHGCCLPEVSFKLLLNDGAWYQPVIPGEAEIQASLNWTPAPVCTGAVSARE